MVANTHRLMAAPALVRNRYSVVISGEAGHGKSELAKAMSATMAWSSRMLAITLDTELPTSSFA